MGLAPRQWVILITFYTSYLIFGACVFYHIEHNAETERRAKELEDRIDINRLLVSFTSPDDTQIQKHILNRVSSYCNKPVTDYKDDEFVKPYQWTFYHAIFFSFIICSTLGYGNITPSGTGGRYFMIAYALVGMPVNMILYTYMGEYFRRNFIKIYRKYKASKFAKHMHGNEDFKRHRWSMIAEITLSLILPALIILVFLPSLIFTYFEGWDYSISVYYSFVTLLTIGFGDFVPTFQPDQERTFGIYFLIYEIFVLIWFVFGLCYILMLIGFIARGMQSKKIRQFEKQLAENIKLTHNRIWSGVSKDVGYLRRILNEVYIMRVRPVFSESIDVHKNYRMTRSQSCPEFTLFSSKSPIPRRKRAFSEIFFIEDEYAKEMNERPLKIQSRHSETNLMRIDKEKTFMQQNVLDNTGDLLAQVVFALNNFNPNVDEASVSPVNGGINLFSDEKILEDEWSVVETPNDLISMKHIRTRAKSLHPQISKISGNTEPNTPQFTWSGDNNDIQDYINAQVKSKNKASKKQKKDNGVIINIDKAKDMDSSTNRRKSIFTAFNNVFRRRNTLAATNTEAPTEEIESSKVPPIKVTVSPVSDRKTSLKIDGSRKPEYVRRPSILSNHSSSSEQVLETTTIADLIRAIESAHVKNMTGSKALDNQMNRRSSLFNQMARRGSVTFSSQLETPSSAGSNRSVLTKPSHNRILTMRQNSGPNRFSVTPVLDTPSSAMSLSPMIQRRIRRFSAVPPASMMSQRRLSTSLQTTPISIRRKQFKQTISPLAKPPPSESTSGS